MQLRMLIIIEITDDNVNDNSSNDCVHDNKSKVHF